MPWGCLRATEYRRTEWNSEGHAMVPEDEVAQVLKRCQSSIFRELNRSHSSDESMYGCDGYYGHAAHLRAKRRRNV